MASVFIVSTRKCSVGHDCFVSLHSHHYLIALKYSFACTQIFICLHSNEHSVALKQRQSSSFLMLNTYITFANIIALNCPTKL